MPPLTLDLFLPAQWPRQTCFCVLMTGASHRPNGIKPVVLIGRHLTTIAFTKLPSELFLRHRS